MSTATATQQIKVVITDIKADSLPKTGWPKRYGQFFAELTAENVTKETNKSASKGNSPTWPEAFIFNVYSSSTLELKIYAYHHLKPDNYIGGMEDSIEALLSEGRNGVVRRTLSKVGGKGPPRDTQAVAEFTISLVPSVSHATEAVGLTTGATSHVGAEDYVASMHDVPASLAIEAAPGTNEPMRTGGSQGDIITTAAGEAVEQATQAVDQMRAGPSILGRSEDAADQLSDIGGQLTTMAKSWQPLLDKVELFTKVTDKIAEVHPYAKIAWSVLSLIPKTLIAQLHRDDNVQQLLNIMTDIFEFVLAAEPLKVMRGPRDDQVPRQDYQYSGGPGGADL